MRPFLRLLPALAVLLTLGSSPIARAGPRQQGQTGLKRSDTMASLPAVVADYAKENPDEPLVNISIISVFTKDEEHQKDLMKQFEAIAPKELKAALASAGNMHNPKVNALGKHLTKAFQQTQAGKDLDQALKPLGRKVSKLGAEKFSIDRKHGKTTFLAFAWIEVGAIEPEAKDRH